MTSQRKRKKESQPERVVGPGGNSCSQMQRRHPHNSSECLPLSFFFYKTACVYRIQLLSLWRSRLSHPENPENSPGFWRSAVAGAEPCSNPMALRHAHPCQDPLFFVPAKSARKESEKLFCRLLASQNSINI